MVRLFKFYLKLDENKNLTSSNYSLAITAVIAGWGQEHVHHLPTTRLWWALVPVPASFESALLFSKHLPINASMLFLSVTRNPVLSSSSWDGRRSMLDDEFCRHKTN